MIQIGEAIFLSVVQGLTEFLPVSSSGHLLAARLIFGLPDTDGTTFDAFLHLGTLGAVLIYYRHVWLKLIRSLVHTDPAATQNKQLLAQLVVSTVPAAMVGYLFADSINRYFRSTHTLIPELLFSAVILWAADRARSVSTRDHTRWSDAIYIGLAQTIALLPGVSRSGVTIAAGRWRGLSRQYAVTFSFLMSAPIIAGASLQSLGVLIHSNEISPGILVVSFIVSLISGLAGITLLLKAIERVSFMPFSLYLVALALVLYVYVGW